MFHYDQLCCLSQISIYGKRWESEIGGGAIICDFSHLPQNKWEKWKIQEKKGEKTHLNISTRFQHVIEIITIVDIC